MWQFLQFDEAVSSRAVFVIVSGSDERAGATYYTLLPRAPENGAQAYRRLRITQMSDLDFLENYLGQQLQTLQEVGPGVSISTQEIASSATSGQLQSTLICRC